MIPPHGDTLINTFQSSLDHHDSSLIVDHNTQIDIYNIASGAYSPLTGFARQEDFRSILSKMRLSDGTLWSIPIILAIRDDQILDTQRGVELHDQDGIHIANLTGIETYPFDKETYCISVFGTTDPEHPGVAKIHTLPDTLIGGDLEVIDSWTVSFEGVEKSSLLSPEQTREHFQEKGLQKIVAFQTRNVPHRGHEYIQKCALEQTDALLVHPVVGEKKSGDFRDEVILGSYQILSEKYYNPQRVVVSCLPWVMRYAGPKEAIMHAIIRQNFGCSHFIVGRDHAGVGDYYGPYDAQHIFDTINKEDLHIQIMCFENAAYCPQVQGVVTDKTSPSPQTERVFISGTKFRQMLLDGQQPPETFIRPEITDYLLSKEDLFV